MPARLERAEPGWKLQLVRGLPYSQLQLPNEKAYMNWLERFAAY